MRKACLVSRLRLQTSPTSRFVCATLSVRQIRTSKTLSCRRSVYTTSCKKASQLLSLSSFEAPISLATNSRPATTLSPFQTRHLRHLKASNVSRSSISTPFGSQRFACHKVPTALDKRHSAIQMMKSRFMSAYTPRKFFASSACGFLRALLTRW